MGIVERARNLALDINALVKIVSTPQRLMPFAKWPAARLLEQNAEKYAQLPALLFEDERHTWRAFNERANRYARFFLSEGVNRGDVVALLMDNCPEYVFIELGLNKIGAVTALINTNLTSDPLAHAINVARAKHLVLGREHTARVREVVSKLELGPAERAIWAAPSFADAGANGAAESFPFIGDRVAAQSVENLGRELWPTGAERMKYVYTSGTTGLPKAAPITNQRWSLLCGAFARVALECTPGDVVYATLPLYHANAQWAGLGSCLVSGATFALRRRFSASQFWSDAVRFEVTHILYIGELCRYLLNQAPSDLERAHHVRIAVGNGLRADIWQRFQDRFGIPLIREFYGATEGNAPMMNYTGRPGMLGALHPGLALLRCDPETGEPIRNRLGLCQRARVGETGLLVGLISPFTRFDGYLDAKATSSKIIRSVLIPGDRYFNSGDLLTLHEDGWVSFADRVGDTFRWKGENVSTNEVADVLNHAPGVLESIVYGVIVPGGDGRAGMASLRTGPEFSIDELAKLMKQRLAPYQRPYFVRLDPSLQTTGTMKHLKNDYRAAGFEPARVGVPLYFRDQNHFVPLDDALYRRIMSGEVAMR